MRSPRGLHRTFASFVALALALGGVVLVAAPAQAATRTVTNNTDADPGSLRDIIDNVASSGDTIVFDASVTAPIVLLSTIQIPYGVTIDGGGDVVISRAASGNFVQFGMWPDDPDQDYTFRDITIQGVAGGGGSGFSASFGITNELPRDVTLSGVTVQNETNNYAPIGEMYQPLGDVLVEDSTFSGNTANTLQYGGLFFNSVRGDSIRVVDSTFSGNSTAGDGGAVSIVGTGVTDQTITFDSVHFSENSAEGHGGAIAADGIQNFSLTGDGTSGNSTFSANFTNDGDGAGLSLIGSGGPTVVRDTDFTDNTAANYGGGAFLDQLGGTLEITDVTFHGNDADNDFGGGLYYGEVDDAVTITRVSFRDNSSDDNGGGLYSEGANTPTSITDSEFLSNSGEGGAGAYFDAADDDVTVTRTTFGANSGEGAGKSVGLMIGTVFADVTVTIDSSSFGLNTARSSDDPNGLSFGTGLMLGTVRIINSTFAETAEPGIPAIYFDDVDDNGTVGIDDSTIVADSYGIDFNSLLDVDPIISNTIVKSTLAAANVGANDGALVQFRYSIASSTLGNDSVNVVGNKVSTDPQLGALANNGGTTATMLPLAGSPAINAGDASFSPTSTLDQRGAGFPRIVGGTIDIGAVEVQASLAATGSTVPWWLIAIAAGVVVLGVVTLVVTRRARAKNEP